MYPYFTNNIAIKSHVFFSKSKLQAVVVQIGSEGMKTHEELGGHLPEMKSKWGAKMGNFNFIITIHSQIYTKFESIWTNVVNFVYETLLELYKLVIYFHIL